MPDPASQLRPLHGPLEVGGVAIVPPLVLLLAVLVLTALAGVAILRYIRRRESPSPAEVAERELTRLLGLGLPERGLVKEHYAQLAAALRRYVASLYGLPASALTPAELLAALPPDIADPAFADYLRRVLRIGDLVRFDHTDRTVAEARNDVVGALDFIRATVAPPPAAAA